MLSSTTLGALVALTLGLGVVSALPGSALAVPAPAERTAASRPTCHPWGSTHAPDRVLRRGCHDYRYTYTVNPPTDDWAAELFLIDPVGRRIASGAIDVDSDPDHGVNVFRFCRPSTSPGRFKIRMKVTYLDGYDLSDGYVKPSYFRLRRSA